MPLLGHRRSLTQRGRRAPRPARVLARAILVMAAAWAAGIGPARAFIDGADWQIPLMAGGIAMEAGDLDKAERHYREALAAGRGHLPDTEAAVLALEGLTAVALRRDRSTEAIDHRSAALELVETARGPDDPETGLAANRLAQLLQYLGDHDRALPLFERALAIYRSRLGPAHRHTGTLHNNLAELHHQAGRPTEAARHYREAIRTPLKTVADLALI